MTTESPMRMVESSGAGKWASSKDASTFLSPLNYMAADELGMLIKGHKFHRGQRNMAPDRSGSAPPTMEGSFASFEYLMAQQSFSPNSSLAGLSGAIGNSQSEEQLRADPSYFAYYWSNVNLNPRLPPPIMSRGNQNLVRQVGTFRNNQRLTSFDDSGDGSLNLSRGPLSTHDEESEDDRSPQQAVEDWAESGSTLLAGENAVSLAGRHKSLVDLIQEDFPRTPSPVYNQTHSSSNATAEKPIGREIQAISLNNLSINIPKLIESKSGSVIETRSDITNAHGLTVNDDPSVASLSRKSYPGIMGSSSRPQKAELMNKDAGSGDRVLTNGATGLDASWSHLIVDDSRNKQEQQLYDKNVRQQHSYSQRDTTHQIYGSQTQVFAEGVNHTHNGKENVFHGQPRLSSVEVQPALQAPWLTHPLYATAATSMTSGNPFFANLSPSGLYAPQYSVGGYALGSTFLPQYIPGYPSPTAIPMHFDATSGQSFNDRTAGVSTGESISHGGGLQHINRFYGQHEIMVQPSFLDPLQMQYFQHPLGDAYGAPGQYDHFVSAVGTGALLDPLASRKGSAVGAYVGDQKFQPPPYRYSSISSPRKGGVGSYYGSSSNVGVMTPFSASPLGSPILPGSPVGGANHSGRRHELRYPQDSFGNMGVYSGWQGGRRGYDSFSDPKKHSFLEELKSTNSRKIDLSEIAGRIVEFSVDQHGSRFIQQKLENCSPEEKASVFMEVLPHASKLVTDVFGNYVIQKFFHHGSPEQRKELADQLSGQMLPLSLQMYGCRVIQKALEVIDVDQKTQLVHELDGHVMRCVQDQNGNHVIQKCIECVPTKKIGFIISSFRGQVATLATHPYGCRVIQRVLEHCSDDSEIQCIVDEILESAYVLAQNQYGNYVIQHVLERGKPHERSQIISKLTGKIVQMSQHKYASNVVEKCLEHGDIAERELLIEEVLEQSNGNDNLLAMMKDQFANYVVQKILEASNDRQREVLLNRIRGCVHALKIYTYGKHIAARFEQLSGEEVEASEP